MRTTAISGATSVACGVLYLVPMSTTTSVQDLMRQVVHTVTVTNTLRDAHGLMRIIGIRHLPVLDADGAIAGVVTDRNLSRGWASDGSSSGKGREQPVAAVMTRNVAWVHPWTSARDAAAVLLESKVGCLPVLDDQQRLVGIVTETDFLEVAHRALTLVDALSERQTP